MFLLSLTFAFFALALASNHLKKWWMWYSIALAVFILSELMIRYELLIPYLIMVAIFILIFIYLLIVHIINKITK